MLIHCQSCELKEKCSNFGFVECDVKQLVEDKQTKELVEIPNGHELVSVQTNKHGKNVIIEEVLCCLQI